MCSSSGCSTRQKKFFLGLLLLLLSSGGGGGGASRVLLKRVVSFNAPCVSSVFSQIQKNTQKSSLSKNNNEWFSLLQKNMSLFSFVRSFVPSSINVCECKVSKRDTFRGFVV